ncbi:MAG: hypothetical protein R3A12_05935 [Ignavibacteria bacterium]
MRKIILSLITLFSLILVTIYFIKPRETDSENLSDLKFKISDKVKPTTDHSKLEALQKEFKTPQEVTKACESCHTEASNR